MTVVNRAACAEVLEFLREHPDRHDQSVYVGSADGRTTANVAGWRIIMDCDLTEQSLTGVVDMERLLQAAADPERPGWEPSLHDLAASSFGLDPSTALWLFCRTSRARTACLANETALVLLEGLAGATNRIGWDEYRDALRDAARRLAGPNVDLFEELVRFSGTLTAEEGRALLEADRRLAEDDSWHSLVERCENRAWELRRFGAAIQLGMATAPAALRVNDCPRPLYGARLALILFRSIPAEDYRALLAPWMSLGFDPCGGRSGVLPSRETW